MENIRFAMAAPWCIVFNQNVFVVVKYDFVVVVCDYYRDRAVLLFRNRLRLNTGLEFAGEIIGHEFANFFFVDGFLLVERKFLVLDSFLNCKCRPRADLQV